MKIEDLPSGRPLDALVAEKVMGWHHWLREGPYDGSYPMFAYDGDDVGFVVYEKYDDGGASFYFAPSSDITSAWRVVEKLRNGGPYDNWWWRLTCADEHLAEIVEGHIPLAVSSADTFPLAVCRAALLAVGITEISATNLFSSPSTVSRETKNFQWESSVNE